jgi:hypothetical protein
MVKVAVAVPVMVLVADRAAAVDPAADPVQAAAKQMVVQDEY